MDTIHEWTKKNTKDGRGYESKKENVQEADRNKDGNTMIGNISHRKEKEYGEKTVVEGKMERFGCEATSIKCSLLKKKRYIVRQKLKIFYTCESITLLNYDVDCLLFESIGILFPSFLHFLADSTAVLWILFRCPEVRTKYRLYSWGLRDAHIAKKKTYTKMSSEQQNLTRFCTQHT